MNDCEQPESCANPLRSDGARVFRYCPTKGCSQQDTPAKPSSNLLRFFDSKHLPDRLQAVVQPMALLAGEMDSTLPDGPEKTTGLRKLLEAKDCFVRAAL